MPVTEKKPQTTAVRPRVLVVDDEPAVADAIGDVITAEVECILVVVDSIESARKAMAIGERFDLLLTDLHLPDGDGMSLLPLLRQSAPNASAIVVTGVATVDKAVSAIRHGAADFVSKPFTSSQLVERVQAALVKQSALAKQEKKLDRLKLAVKRLSDARRLVSKKVDLLCNDLVSAYGELSKQMEGVRTQEGFRKYIDNAKDLEQLLCHSMDWLLRQLGYANCAVWLAGEEGEFQLGAYMKYTTPGDATITDAIKRVVLPMAGRDGMIRVEAAELKTRLTAEEYQYIQGQTVMAVNCSYLGEALASVVLFRDATTPFKDEDAEMMLAVAPIFAVSLASIVHDEGEAEADDDEGGTTEEPRNDSAPKKREKKNDADWWKRGEAPPF